MKLIKLLPAAALAALMGISGMAGAADKAAAAGADVPPAPGEHGETGAWYEHNEIMEILPQDKQDMLRSALEKSRDENKPIFEKLSQLHEEREELLKAESFDKDAFLKKSAEIDDLQQKFEQNHARIIADVAAKFSPEERRVLVVMGHTMMMHHHGMNGPGDWHDKDKDGAPHGEHGENE